MIEYLLHIAVMVAIYAMLAASLELLAGQIGLVSLCHGAFFGLGGYATAIGATKLGLGFETTLVLSVLVGALGAIFVALPSLRLRDDYFVIATLCFQMIVVNVLNNWLELTRGPLGISGIPAPSLFGWSMDSQNSLVFLALAVALAAVWLLRRLTTSPYGRVLRAIREDEVFVTALGKSVLHARLIAFVTSAAVAAIAGCLYARYVSYIDPSNFTISESILVVSMVILGGAGTTTGPLLGATVLVLLPEFLRFVGMPPDVAGNARQMIYGIALVGMVLFRPRGLVGNYGFGR